MKYDLTKVGISSRKIFKEEREYIESKGVELGLDKVYIESLVNVFYAAIAMPEVSGDFLSRLRRGYVEINSLVNSKIKNEPEKNKVVEKILTIENGLLRRYRNRNLKYNEVKKNEKHDRIE